jgi:hypothetical protein
MNCLFILRVPSATTPAPFSILKESLTDFYLPRCFAFSKYGSSDTKSKFPDHNHRRTIQRFIATIQKDVVNAYLQEANHGSGSGTIVLTCGGGKTWLTLHALWE